MNNYPFIEILNRKIGEKYEPLIIAEIGINHGGSLKIAKKMVDAAINSGAEIIKHQTHIASEEMSKEAKKVIPKHTSDSIYNIIKNCQLNESDEYKLMQHVLKKNKIFISTPFSIAAVDRLVQFEIPAFKIGSGECNNYHFVEYISKFSKPVIMSTGMNSLETISPSIEILRKNKVPFALLHCTNIYPTPPENVRLDCITLLKSKFKDAVVGLSDHTTSNYTSFGAVSLGASIIERHFTDNKNREGPDISCSMDPKNLRDLIEGSKILFKARGKDKKVTGDEKNTLKFANASVTALTNINKGEILSKKNICLKRPGNGSFFVNDYVMLIGKKVKNNIAKDEQIKKESVIF